MDVSKNGVWDATRTEWCHVNLFKIVYIAEVVAESTTCSLRHWQRYAARGVSFLMSRLEILLPQISVR
jgi:hypothetical protein